ncbi:innexin unc-9-like [Mya arenaria]|uniref:innexin unc-9-like n=1 Tax=Mya arenaria TaxID=6604 RepID=UPI0022E90BAC|nr:innexin unc-9-like [Mya arenaria]
MPPHHRILRSAILGSIPGITQLRASRNDDRIDRLNHVYTTVLLVVFAVVVSTTQFAGHPIHCWHPPEFEEMEWYESYIDNYCWISNTYHVPFSEELFPVNISDREDREITYYQWVPIVLLLQAFLFKLPNVVWNLLHTYGGLKLNNLVKMAETTQLLNPVERQTVIENIASHIDKWLDAERAYKWNKMTVAKQRFANICCLFCSKRSGTFLCGLFTTVKLLYVCNVIGQFFMLNLFMSMDYMFYGFDILKGFQTNQPWKQSPRFPLVTFCDFHIRQQQNIQRWTLQCVLPINLFNEKVFIFLWFWLFLMVILSIYNLVSWCYIVMLKRHRYQYVKKYLKVTNRIQGDFDDKLCRRFANHYFRDDGVFVLRIISNNATDLVTTELVNYLWQMFQDKQSCGRPSRAGEKLRPLPRDANTSATERNSIHAS